MPSIDLFDKIIYLQLIIYYNEDQNRFMCSVIAYDRHQKIKLFHICQLIQLIYSPFVMNPIHKSPSKPTHSNLNELIDMYQTQSCLFTRSQSLSLSNNARPKTMSMHRLTLNQINNPIFKPLNLQNGHFVHTRSMSNFVSRALVNSKETGLKTSQQIRKQKMINLLSTQNFRKQLMNTRKMSAVQAQYRSADTRNKNAKKDYDLRFNVLQNNYELQKEGQIKESTHDKNSNFQSRVQYDFNEQRIDSLQNQRGHDLRNPLTLDKHEYLKKNSSINKSILNTILKQKIAKQSSSRDGIKEDVDPAKNIRNQEIVKMIKVYKGVEPVLSLREKLQETTTENKTKQNKKKDQLYIQGWQHETQDFEFNRSQGPLNANPSQYVSADVSKVQD